ncbi:patatin-like phospholipase family protein [Candidatus Poribacteria bacterium]|nr:patatin-like phospholipase family protein [Candidatus Poribacteria bacterium]
MKAITSRVFISSLSCFILLQSLWLLACGSSVLRSEYKDYPWPPSLTPQPPQPNQDDDTLIFVSLSGGGTRAATMSWKTLEELEKIDYTYKDKNGKIVQSNLAAEIDYISGISGGSFAAAAWCLYQKDTKIRSMKTFREDFIEKNIEGKLAKKRYLQPWRLLFESRSVTAAKFYNSQVFKNATFGDLLPHPVLWIHATHLALGRRFTYSTYGLKKDFVFVQADLSRYPVGYACAASSAFPILLSPITLINYDKGKPMNLMQDVDYEIADLNRRAYVEKDMYCKTRDFYNDPSNKYIHLVDGGLVDNQGLKSIIDEFETNGIINTRLNDQDHPLKRLIIINVNAGVASEDTSAKSKKAPGIPVVVKYTMTTSMNILSAERWTKIKDLCNKVNQDRIALRERTPSWAQLEMPYTIEISFRNIIDGGDREKCRNLPTSFSLNKTKIALIDRVVPTLIEEDPDLQRLKEKLLQEANEYRSDN